MIDYIIQVVLFQLLFLTVYDLFLGKETFFTKNRIYLLATAILSFLLPLIKIATFQKAVSEEFVIYLPEIMLSPQSVILQTTWYPSTYYPSIVYWSGVLLYTILFIIKVVKIIRLIRYASLIKKSTYTLVSIPEQIIAFSFFNYIFLGDKIPMRHREKIILHEQVHSEQKHSVDLVFFEILKIMMWFNPLLYLYQKRIALIHEYLSDEIASKTIHKDTYINNLLSNFFQVENIAFINQFYKQSLIKKRIKMMTKKQSKKMNQLKYFVLIPVVTSMLLYVACTNSEIAVDDNLSTEYQSKIKIQDQYYLIKQNDIGETIALNHKGEKVNLESLLPKEVKSMYFENGYLITEYKGDGDAFTNDDLLATDLEERVEEISFAKIDNIPTFPGCEEGDKKCFSKMTKKHFVEKFDMKMVKKLGLSPGVKRIYIGFKIDKEGTVTDVQVRAPHEKIKTAVQKVMESLPKMIPGQHNGANVNVKYAIPFSIMIE